MITQIEDEDAARQLGRRLNGDERTHPIAVVSTPAGHSVPWIEVDDLSREYGDLVEVVLIRTGAPTRAFSAVVPPMTQVYGGAGRVYPIGNEWVTDLHRSPLRFAFDESTGAVATRRLIADGLAMAAEAGLLQTAPREQGSPTSGTVKGFPAQGRALVELLDGSTAVIAQELVAAEVPIERLVSIGQRVEGVLDARTRRIDVRHSLRPADEALDHYRAGDVVLARVTQVSSDAVGVMLYPGVVVTADRQQVTSNVLDNLRSLFTVDEVVAVRLLHAGAEPQVSLLDIDDDEVAHSAPCLLPDGPAWLVPPTPDEAIWQAPAEVASAPVLAPHAPDTHAVEARVEPATAPPDAVPVTPEAPLPQAEAAAAPVPRPTPLMLDPQRRDQLAARPAPDTEPATPTEPTPPPGIRSRDVEQLHLTIAHHKASVRDLTMQLSAMKEERAMLADQLTQAHSTDNRLRSELKQLRTENRRRARGGSDARSVAGLFLDAEESFRFEVLVAWATRFPAPDKPNRPLPDFTLGSQFLSSLESLEGIKREKVVDVVVEVLTGLVNELPGRDVHRLRRGEAGNSDDVIRDDGAVCMRAKLQASTPSARRLHYWVAPGGSIELSRVTVHDDFSP